MAARNTESAKMPGLHADIHAKKERIGKDSGQAMRKKGAGDAPEADAFRKTGKTAKGK